MEEKTVTATEIMVKAMEDFNESEPETLMVLYTIEDGAVVCHSNARRVEAIGLLEVARDMVMRNHEGEW